MILYGGNFLVWSSASIQLQLKCFILDPRRQMESNPAPLVFIIQFDPLANNLIPDGNFASIWISHPFGAEHLQKQKIVILQNLVFRWN